MSGKLGPLSWSGYPTVHYCAESKVLVWQASGVLTFGVPVTERRCPHVAEPQRAFAAAVHKQMAVLWVELCCRDHLCQVLHVGWLNVHNV